MATPSAPAQTDLFTFGPCGKKPLKEQVTPHKLSLLILIQEYCELKKKNLPTVVTFGQDNLSDPNRLSESEKFHFMTTILHLLQSPDFSLKELLDNVRNILKPQHYDAFCEKLHVLYEEGARPLIDFFQSLSSIKESSSEVVVSKSSVLGLFIRRMVLAFDKLSFHQVTKLHRSFKDYYEALLSFAGGEGSQDFGGSLIDSVNSLPPGQPLTRSKLAFSFGASDHGALAMDDVGRFFSQKQAEYFIAQQSFLLQHNENKALPPAKLQEKIVDMLRVNPNMVEAHFLSYLNNLRVKEYCTAVHNLYHFFDRNTNITEAGTANRNLREEDTSRRYAALNLASLHFRFGQKEESLAALHEAIRMAQETNDHVCLQHALGWLHRINDQSDSQTAILMERSIMRSGELSLPNVTSLGVQALARHNAFESASKPATILEFLLKSDILNCQHSQSGFMCISSGQKAALWGMYGRSENISMYSQLVLNLDTSESGVYYNGESVCIAICNIATLHASSGQYTAALDIISKAKQRFQPNSEYAYIWMTCEQQILFDRALLNRKLSHCESIVSNLEGLNKVESDIRNAILLKEKGEVTKSLDSLNGLLDSLKKKDSISPVFVCRVLIVLAEVYIQTDNSTVAMDYVLECITKASQNHLQYLVSMASVLLAFIQLQMKMPKQAISVLNKQMMNILSHGPVYDQARTLLLYAKCQVASSANEDENDRKTILLSAVCIVNKAVELFKQVEAYFRTKDAIYFQTRLYHELGYITERNKLSYQFKRLDQQYPTLSQMAVLVV